MPQPLKTGMETESTSNKTTSWSVLSTLWVQDQYLIQSHSESQEALQDLVDLIDQSAHAGTAHKQATHFSNLYITQASLKLDGVLTDKEIECDFGARGDSTIAYTALFDVAFQNTQNASHGVSLTEFREKSTIFAWNSEDLPGSQAKIIQNVGISLLSSATTTVHTALLIRQTKRPIAITDAGRVLNEQ